MTDFVVTEKLMLLFPARIVTLAGTVADELLLDRATVMLLETGPLKVTVPVDEVPPVTGVGFSATEESTRAGLMVSEAVLFTLA